MDQFKMQRRNSVRLEVDGIFDGLEEHEDIMLPSRISVKECSMLRRVLGNDKQDVLPKACRMANQSQSRGFMSRLAHIGDSPDVAGKVTLPECHLVSDSLKMQAGGQTFLPTACAAMIKLEEKLESEKYEAENARVYERLKRRQTWNGAQDYPPTVA